MADSDLVFSQPPTSGGHVDLVFGADGSGPGIPPVTVGGGGRLSGMRGRMSVRVAVVVSGARVLSGMRGRMSVAYDVNVSRPTVGQTLSGWQDAKPLPVATRSRWQQSAPQPVGVHSGWEDARPLPAATRSTWQDTLRLQRIVASAYQQARRLDALSARSNFQTAQPVQASLGQRFQVAVRLPLGVRQSFQEAYRDRRLAVGQHFQVGIALSARIADAMGIAVPLVRAVGGRYQEAWPPRPGRSVILPPEPPDPDPCYLPGLPADLIFSAPADSSLPANLVFVCERHTTPPGATIVVPIRKVYMTVNSLSLLRVDGAVPIDATAFSMSLDVDSWTWSWSASLPASELPKIRPSVGGDPVDILATVNGVPYRLVAESFSRQTEHKGSALSVRGRGRSAILDAPYAPVRNHGNALDFTAQQLMGDVLTVNGVGIGWGVDWGLSDWLVPGNVWTHQGVYMSALLDIAGAAGGYIQPHNTDQVLRVLPRYPVGPWDWGDLTPDFELPADVVSVEGTDWQRLPAYNRVHVSGVGAGVLAEVTRGGTGGNVIAPMVTHPLITHSEAARQRGLAELSNTGTQALLSLRLPVLALTGVIKPGALVRYVESGTTHLGLVRSTALEFQRPTLRQVLTVETHPA